MNRAKVFIRFIYIAKFSDKKYWIREKNPPIIIYRHKIILLGILVKVYKKIKALLFPSRVLQRVLFKKIRAHRLRDRTGTF